MYDNPNAHNEAKIAYKNFLEATRCMEAFPAGSALWNMWKEVSNSYLEEYQKLERDNYEKW